MLQPSPAPLLPLVPIMAASETTVYASFPITVSLDANLNSDPSNWHWIPCLTLPRGNVLQFSLKPYKWIRYAIGVVVGAEGDLSTSRDVLNLVDYNAELPTQSAALYYHIGEDEK